jgi:hypothetical protein
MQPARCRLILTLLGASVALASCSDPDPRNEETDALMGRDSGTDSAEAGLSHDSGTDSAEAGISHDSGTDATDAHDIGDVVANETGDVEANDTGAVDASGDSQEELTPTHKVCDLTGPQTSAWQYGVGGTDLGIAVRQPDGDIAYIFGDTFEQATVGGPGWRSPVLLRSPSGRPDGCIEFTSAAGGDYAKQILDYDHNHPDYSTWLPSDAITIGDRMYLHFIVNQGLGNVQWTQIAYSDDNGEHWTLSGAVWPADANNNLQQLWTWELGDDGYVYVFSTSFISRQDPIILHRVAQENILDAGAYEPWGYHDGQWGWGNPASVVLPGQFGELSLRRIEDKWVLAWFNAGEYRITIKVLDHPTSNLHTAPTYEPILGGHWGPGGESDTQVAQLYGGYIHPDSTLADLHLIISQWNTSTNWPYRSMHFVTGVPR